MKASASIPDRTPEEWFKELLELRSQLEEANRLVAERYEAALAQATRAELAESRFKKARAHIAFLLDMEAPPEEREARQRRAWTFLSQEIDR